MRIVPWIKLSWHSCCMWDKPRWLSWFLQFLCESFLPLILKDSTTDMRGLTVYVKEGHSFAQDSSLENSADSYLCFRLALLHSVSYIFFLYQSPSSSLCTVFVSRKLYGFLLMFSIGFFTTLSVLHLFPLSMTFFVFMHSFWFYFI